MKAIYSPMHGCWIVLRADRPELVLASGKTQEEALRKADPIRQQRTC